MISILSIVKRFLAVMRYGWDDREFRGLTMMLASWVALGTVTYSIYESWTVIDAFYFSVMTLTTIGYGDLAPTEPVMRLYTPFYAVMGIGLFVAFNARLAQYAFESRRLSDATTQTTPRGSDDEG